MLKNNSARFNDEILLTLVSSPIYRALSFINLQQILAKIERVNFAAGEMIIDKDQPNEYFFFIEQGECLLKEKVSNQDENGRLAVLRQYHTFGEASLIPNDFLVNHVIAESDSVIFRLDKQTFELYVRGSIVRYIGYDQIQPYTINNSQLIDVRPRTEFKKHRLPGSINIPLSELRMKLSELDRQKKVILICNDGKLCEIAVLMLMPYHIDTLVIEGGMQSVNLPNIARAIGSMETDRHQMMSEIESLRKEKSALEEKLNDLSGSLDKKLLAERLI